MSKRIGVFYGVYGFRCVLDSLLNVFDSQHVDAICSLGDLVGLGCDSNYCVDTLIRNHGIILQGMMEQVFVDNRDWPGLFSTSKARLLMNKFANECTDNECREILKQLKTQCVIDDTWLIGSVDAITIDCNVNGKATIPCASYFSKIIAYSSGYSYIGPSILDSTSIVEVKEKQLSWEQIRGRPVSPGLAYCMATFGVPNYAIVCDHGVEFGRASYDATEIFSNLNAAGVDDSYIKALRSYFSRS